MPFNSRLRIRLADYDEYLARFRHKVQIMTVNTHVRKAAPSYTVTLLEPCVAVVF